jgi:hypothetical protein
MNKRFACAFVRGGLRQLSAVTMAMSSRPGGKVSALT